MSKLSQNSEAQNLKEFALKNSNWNKDVTKKVAYFKAEVQEIEESPKQRKETEKYRNILLSHREELFKMWLIEINWIWYFDECINWRKWPKIGKNNLISFPNSTWNKARWIWDSAWVLRNKDHLRKEFKFLWLKVATEAQELERYKNLLLSHKEELLKIWLIEIDNVWYLFECMQWKSWQKIWKIWNKYLSSFPNATLNKKWWAGNKVWTIQDDKWLGIMLENLWFKVATESQELERYKNLLLSHREQLFKIWLQEIEWIWYFYKCKKNQDWQKIWKIWNKFLGSLIKAEFMREKWIWRVGKWDVVNRAQLKEMFKLVNIPVATERQEIEQKRKDKNAKSVQNNNSRSKRKKWEKKSNLNTNKEVIDENFRDEFRRFIKSRINNLNKWDYSLKLELDYLMRLPDISKNVFLEFVEWLPEDDKNEIKKIFPTNEKILQRIDCFVEDRIKNLWVLKK
ncbi:MAG: hypothetical protein ACD_49C00050G0006 [uncultured bacterium (gcode 4)]|uniref:Uncharacterized protein n=1 Tax=uncultured bacterium (gcode 4) TaxID=1234023 RepID=K2AX73_9BACT|nr:MAG: hypothetical protein ACD_49C00050G0006 [uncultured bacterium (gcode 4)]